MAEIKVIKGDITTLGTDAIVNAANESLLAGGGVCGAIHAAAGPELQDACRQIGYCATGDATITPGFKLPAKWVIHAVGPNWYGGFYSEARNLGACYTHSLELAAEQQLESIAFPCISAGIFGYPLEEASKIAVDSVRSFLANQPGSLREVVFCTYTQEQFELYTRLLAG